MLLVCDALAYGVGVVACGFVWCAFLVEYECGGLLYEVAMWISKEGGGWDGVWTGIEGALVLL